MFFGAQSLGFEIRARSGLGVAAYKAEGLRLPFRTWGLRSGAPQG